MCPKVLFVEVNAQYGAEAALAPNASASALISIGSPSRVPVPCVTTYWICCALTPAASYTCWISCVCAAPLGAFNPFVRPS